MFFRINCILYLPITNLLFSLILLLRWMFFRYCVIVLFQLPVLVILLITAFYSYLLLLCYMLFCYYVLVLFSCRCKLIYSLCNFISLKVINFHLVFVHYFPTIIVTSLFEDTALHQFLLQKRKWRYKSKILFRCPVFSLYEYPTHKHTHTYIHTYTCMYIYIYV